MNKPFIDVAAGLIIRPDGQLLLAQRPTGKPWAGWWELPGGKIEPGETVLQALARELKEELDINVSQATRWVTHIHEYPTTVVRLAFCQVTRWDGQPTGMEGQALAWVRPHEPINAGPLLPATQPPLRWLQLPDRYLITAIGSARALAPFLARLESALQAGLGLVQFREPHWQGSATELQQAFQQVVAICHRYKARCLVNSCHPNHWQEQADGLHLRAADAHTYDGPTSAGKLLGVSAHTLADLARARAVAADFAVLGHVLATPSHPNQPGMEWQGFEALALEAGLPVFAIGGQSDATLLIAKQHGAHGIAGIRGVAPVLANGTVAIPSIPGADGRSTES